MIRLQAVLLLFPDLDAEELAGWISQAWVRPQPRGKDYLFMEIDVARVRLIHDLRHAMDVPESTVPLVLHLLDQIYDLRAALAARTP